MSFSSILYNLLFPAFRTVSAPFRASLLFFCRPPTFSADMHVLGAPPLLDGDTYGFDGHECRVCPCKTRESSALLSPTSLCSVTGRPSFPCLNFAKGAGQHLLGSVRLPRVISVGPPRPSGRSSPLCAPAGKAAHTEALGQYSSASWDCHRQPPCWSSVLRTGGSGG